MELEREPSYYTRLLVIFGLVPLLLLDLFADLPEGGFVAGGAIIFALAAGIHLYGGEPRAAAGWITFGAALGIVALFDVAADPILLGAFIILLVAGLLLLASERMAELRSDG